MVIVDEVYAELISDPENYEKDRDVKSFFEKAAFVTIEKTFTGEHAVADRAAGKKVKKNLGETAIAEFLSDFEPGSGINKYTKPSESVLLLFEDSGIPFVKIIRSSSNIHLLSTVAMLRGLEEDDDDQGWAAHHRHHLVHTDELECLGESRGLLSKMLEDFRK